MTNADRVSPSLEDILEKHSWPYSTKDDQLEILAQIYDAKLEGNVSDAAKKAGVDRPRIYEFQDSYNKLTSAEKVVLVSSLLPIVRSLEL
jgi:hypothetical protein